MTAVQVGDLHKINYPYEDVDRWHRVRIVSVNEQSGAVWVRLADHIGNSFPVSPDDLRPVSVPAVREGR